MNDHSSHPRGETGSHEELSLRISHSLGNVQLGTMRNFYAGLELVQEPAAHICTPALAQVLGTTSHLHNVTHGVGTDAS